jgi:AcrR family transcriptional regulator
MTFNRPYAGQSLEDRQATRRSKFIDAGIELFGTVGRQGTTVRAVCREAGLTDRYFYEQFTNTEDLLVAVLAECSDRLQTAMLIAVEGADGTLRGMAEAGIDAVLTMAESDPRFARVAWFEALGVSERVDRHYTSLNERFATFILLISTEQLGGDVDDPRSIAIAAAAAGGIKDSIVRWILNGFTPSRQELAAWLTDFMLALSSTLAE